MRRKTGSVEGASGGAPSSLLMRCSARWRFLDCLMIAAGILDSREDRFQVGGEPAEEDRASCWLPVTCQAV